MSTQLSRDELIQLIERIIHAQGTEAELHSMRAILQANVPHLGVLDLIYYPAPNAMPKAEDILEEALKYKPIVL